NHGWLVMDLTSKFIIVGECMKSEEKTRLTRERIINAGINEFGSKGYAASSINNVSDSGIAKGLIYHNFTGKDELYIECLRICFEEITEDLSCHEDCADHRKYFDMRMKLFNEKREKAAMVLEALIAPPEKHYEEILRIREPYDRMNEEWIRKILSAGKLRNDVDIDSAMKYLSVMQDMFNSYCCGPRFANKSFESLISLHEEQLPKAFEYMLYGVMKGE
ncbi:MAG: TetR/AcrR family transcriptional regulator, partial [Oscillospiraceae bacterium]